MPSASLMLSLRSTLLPLVLLTLAWPAAAQEADWHRFYPLDVGNTWEYERGEFSLNGYRRITVLRDTTIGGLAYRLIGVQQRTATLQPVSESLCAARLVEETGQVEWVSVEGTCEIIPDRPDAAFDLRGGGSDPGESVWIGGTEYAVTTRSPFLSEYPTFEFGEDIGLLKWRKFSGGCFCYVDSEWLVYAEVGGTVYGTPPDEHDATAFYPLNVGDVRMFDRRGIDPGRTYELVVVVGDTMIAGLPYHLVEIDSFDWETSVRLGGARCALRLSPPTSGGNEVITLESEGGSCSTLSVSAGVWDLRRLSAVRSETVDIGTGSYPLTTVSFSRGGDISWHSSFGQGIGPLSWDAESRVGPQGGHYRYSYDLVFAAVGGEVYGVNPVANSPDGEERTPFDFFAYPSPARASATLAFILPAPDAVTVKAFDVLGRRLLHVDLGAQPMGASSHRLDLSALPAGLYIFRVVTPSGQQATQRIVLVE